MKDDEKSITEEEFNEIIKILNIELPFINSINNKE